MTLHAFDRSTNESMKCAPLPLEFVDWMAENFNGALIQHFRQIDPYASVLIPDGIVVNAVDEFKEVRTRLKNRFTENVPQVVDLFGPYGVEGALKTVHKLLEFFEFSLQNSCKVVSIGD